MFWRSTCPKACSTCREGRETAERFRQVPGGPLSVSHALLPAQARARSALSFRGGLWLHSLKGPFWQRVLPQVVLDGTRVTCGVPDAVTVIWRCAVLKYPAASHVLTPANVIMRGQRRIQVLIRVALKLSVHGLAAPNSCLKSPKGAWMCRSAKNVTLASLQHTALKAWLNVHVAATCAWGPCQEECGDRVLRRFGHQTLPANDSSLEVDWLNVKIGPFAAGSMF